MIFKRAIAKLRAQNGTAITIELVIVTLGVLIALGAQQWANNRSQRIQMDVDMKAVREELAVHYEYAVEYRVAYPCLRAQMDQLRNHVLSSGATLNPVRLYRDGDFSFVIQEPDKLYSNDAWQAAIDDGTTQRISPRMRRILAAHYGQLHELETINQRNTIDADFGYIALTQPLPLDPTVRYSIMKEIEQERARMEYVDYLNGQVIDYIQSLGMLPPPKDAIKTTERWGTYQFCKAHGLPMRSFKDAMVAVPN